MEKEWFEYSKSMERGGCEHSKSMEQACYKPSTSTETAQSCMCEKTIRTQIGFQVDFSNSWFQQYFTVSFVEGFNGWRVNVKLKYTSIGMVLVRTLEAKIQQEGQGRD
jgi:hypothetical protein